ncbi:TPA: glycosyl hydrolase, partial [Candidatus Sumerlaeota bacterium]|nr:glycosyl hydrolase [Candidatus Sumerlaeota bacterium]
IPVYNCEDYLSQAIESVLAQTFSDFELIVLDNCSTDNTLAIAQSFSDPRIRIQTSPSNIGAEGNFNRALKEATGKYIKLLCADDFLYPDCLAKQVAALENDPDVVLVNSSRQVVDAQNKRLLTRGFPGCTGRKSGKSFPSQTIRWGTNLIGEPSSVLFRSDAAQKTGCFNGIQPYFIDLDFWLRLLQHGDLIVLKEPLCAFRVTAGSWSAEIGRKQAQQFIEFSTRLRNTQGFGVSALDCWAGTQMAKLYGFLRRQLYRKLAKP